MNLRQEDLHNLSRITGFKNADMLEKVVQLIGLLNEIFDNNYLKNRLVLKGGTALNLFYFNLPRLSVDIDFNYIGSIDRHTMLEERKELEEILMGLCQRSGFTIKRVAKEHAGGKWRLNYASSVKVGGNIEIDLSYLHRVTFYPILVKDSIHVGLHQANKIPLLDLHELAAGKLAALMSRKASRDLYDVSKLFHSESIDMEKLRLVFMVYGGMNRKDWRTLKIEDIGFDSEELKKKLVPVLKQQDIQQSNLTEQLIHDCKKIMSNILPFRANEQEFLDLLLDSAQIEPSLLTTNFEEQNKIRHHPGLLWKAQHVKKFKESKKRE
ncbi:MAG TPA: nucleotidyl transferase AbiEii/AbiGii toxin family protein [Gammaproteobacteria bacterium]|nr:nucleotidyl transferase AbiEii/AbiGii toxin family protein [Gammaproteobacteria bacterium]